MTAVRIEGRTYAAADQTAEENAVALANAVVTALGRKTGVEVSLHGVRGTSSTYFNTLLAQIVAEAGREALRKRVRFVCETQTQTIALNRSMDVVAA